MLMISRRQAESFFIGQTRVVVADLRGNQVRLAIDAPKGTHVRRFELPKQCSCRAHGSCELHGCGCKDAVHAEVKGEVRCWCPDHNVTWTLQPKEALESSKVVLE